MCDNDNCSMRRPNLIWYVKCDLIRSPEGKAKRLNINSLCVLFDASFLAVNIVSRGSQFNVSIKEELKVSS